MLKLIEKIAVKLMVFAEIRLSVKEKREMRSSNGVYEIAKQKIELKRRYEMATKNNKKKFENNLKKLANDERKLVEGHKEIELKIFN